LGDLSQQLQARAVGQLLTDNGQIELALAAEDLRNARRLLAVWMVSRCANVRETDSNSLAFRSAMRTRMVVDYAPVTADLIDE